MTARHALFEVSDEIATITLNRPEAKNALSNEMRDDLNAALAECQERAGRDVKAVIITGAGGAFCAGGDVKGMGDRSKDPIANRSRMRDSHDTMYQLVHLELPVIALVDGPAAGAGANIALSADFVLATPRAMFMQAFGRIGLVPDWGGFYVLPRLVGLQTAKELVFTARKVYAEEAKELGLVYKIVGQDTAMAEARAFAGRFRNASTSAIGIAKNILNQAHNQDHRTLLELEASGQSIARMSEFHKEAVRRFREKEPSLFDWEALDRADAGVKTAAE
ncbi:MAG: enoyl-CoA hydratase/isomerase family protein [Alphaproteobacteria bacterium]|nr:enoyl-CoA hydratase/isomerase family protein [Alphaproteobacteria bacterium]MCB9931625.1 enoyl-CoA hydratase/isomerase family protein [Alphaproteobacteria bacterium]